MARALLLWCIAGTAATYAEYGARAPLYDEHAADYQHAPDAPPALDYKYEEHARDKPNELEFGEAAEIDPWPRPARKPSRRIDDNQNLEEMENLGHDNDFARPKPFDRYTRHRSILKSRKADRSDYNFRYDRGRVRNDEVLDVDDLAVVEEFSRDKSRRAKTASGERVVRRRARDEYARRRSEAEDSENLEASVERELQTWNLDREELRRRPPDERRHDEDYYDMKRVLDIKSQLPALMRRTQARPLVPEPPRRVEPDLLPNRRTLDAATPPRPPPTTAASRPLLAESSRPTPTTTARIQTTSTTSQLPTVGKSTLVNNGTDHLSLAEKSRLSILKKAQRKESVRSDAGTSKPPVLLQVTGRMGTVVVVEPPTSAHPWMRARVVSEDSPQRLRRVKQLMRHKLLSGARSITDLTDNWDDLVCDYIDMSLLDNAVRPAAAILFLCLSGLLIMNPLLIL